MNTYQIADLERLTGIKAHTIRIWEQRYQLIEPHRTATNIRYYDDEQVKKLLKVSTLLQQGNKISAISQLNDTQLNLQIKELEATANPDVLITSFVNELTAAMLTFDELAFERTFAAALVRFGMYEAMIKVFYPFLKNTGLLWSANEAMPVQEHFASTIIRRKLLVAIDGLPTPTKKNNSFLLFLPQNEWHETGLLFADYILRSRGYKTFYLSQNVPIQNLQEVIKSTHPSHLLSFYITRQGTEKWHAQLYDLAIKNKECQILISGSSYALQEVKMAKNMHILHSPTDLLSLI